MLRRTPGVAELLFREYIENQYNSRGAPRVASAIMVVAYV